MGQVRNIETKYILKHGIRGGYQRVNLAVNKRTNCQSVHRLLAHAYIPKTNKNYNVVNHIDENKLNNNIDNLE